MRLKASLAVLALLCAAPAHAGWRGAEWNTSPEQVAGAMKGEAPLTKAGANGKAAAGRLAGNKSAFVWDGDKFDVDYFYDEAGLKSVTLEPKKASRKACMTLVDRVIAERGQPLRMSDQTIIKLLIWHDKPAGNRIRLMLTGTGEACWLHYERLTDFEERDLQNPGLESKPPVWSGGGVGGSPVDVIVH